MEGVILPRAVDEEEERVLGPSLGMEDAEEEEEERTFRSLR